MPMQNELVNFRRSSEETYVLVDRRLPLSSSQAAYTSSYELKA